MSACFHRTVQCWTQFSDKLTVTRTSFRASVQFELSNLQCVPSQELSVVQCILPAAPMHNIQKLNDIKITHTSKLLGENISTGLNLKLSQARNTKDYKKITTSSAQMVNIWYFQHCKRFPSPNFQTTSYCGNSTKQLDQPSSLDILGSCGKLQVRQQLSFQNQLEHLVEHCSQCDRADERSESALDWSEWSYTTTVVECHSVLQLAAAAGPTALKQHHTNVLIINLSTQPNHRSKDVCSPVWHILIIFNNFKV